MQSSIHEKSWYGINAYDLKFRDFVFVIEGMCVEDGSLVEYSRY